MKKTALYIHWPFCKAKCPYCDFNSHVRDAIDQEEFGQSYIKEMNYFREYLQDRTITSIFFGGGTPSLMPANLVSKIINNASKLATISDDVEITLEGNPTSIEAAKYKEFKSAGVNRVSLGIQSLRDTDLKFLGREHSASEALKALEIAASLFNNYSFDLIYARPNQTLEGWKKELNESLQYVGNHFSLYQLTIEKGTPFYTMYKKSEFTLPDEELAADMYELTNDTLSQRGLNLYEVSNYAKPGYESRHNLAYWRYDDYLGIGAGAHSRITTDQGKRAIMMVHSPEKWSDSVNISNHGTMEDNILNNQSIIEEYLMMGLRILEGINKAKFLETTGKPLASVINQKKLQEFCKANLLNNNDLSLQPTQAGLLVINSIISDLLI